MNPADTDADYLRELAALCRHERRATEDPAVTLEAAAGLLDARADNEPTEPRALQLRTCPNCGHSVPERWTPPEG